MQKYIRIFITILILTSTSYANNNQLFQSMDNQIAIGYGYSSSNAYNPNFSGVNQTTNYSSANVNVEQLFNNNVWLNLNGNFIFSANQPNNGQSLFGSTQSFGLPASVTGKAGYSFNWSTLGLQVIPYLTTGVVLNYNSLNIANNGFKNSYYILYGGGARLEYVIIPSISVYFDQLIGYLSDRGLANNLNQSAMNYNSTLGAKFNVAKHLQLGIQANFNQISTTNSSIGFDPSVPTYRNNNQSTYGGLFSVAYLFDDTSNINLHHYNNSVLARLDNSYSIGYGFASSTNSYGGGNLPNIGSGISFINLEYTHLFDSNVWAKINGSLITSISQSNQPPGLVNSRTPTYLGFPGAATANVGYAFAMPKIDLQLIPYANLGIVGNINSYNIRANPNLSYILSHDLFLQYGIGGRAEYAINRNWEVYFDQLLALMNDRSVMELRNFRSTSTLGTKYNVYDNIQLGINGFYDIINPNSTIYNPDAGINYAAKQSTYGGLVTIGVTY